MNILLKAVLLLCISIVAAAEDFSFVQICDPQLGRGGYEHDKGQWRVAVHYTNELKPDLALICGDLIDTNKTNAAYVDFCNIRDEFTIPSYCAIGNNDIPYDFSQYIGADYKAVDHKGITFLTVNTMLWIAPVAGQTEAQDAWLLATLQDAHAKGNPIIVAGHHPLFLVSPTEPDMSANLPMGSRTQLLTLFHTYGVVAYLAGHTHTNFATTYDGIQFVTSASTSINHDTSPLGLRVWHITASLPYLHEYLPLTNIYANGNDSDRDGIANAIEDANQDGIRDAGETDLFNPDTDGDGINDGTERSFGLDPLTPDAATVPVLTWPGILAVITAMAALGAACCYFKSTLRS
jgi:hypothetical protein